MIKIYYIIFFLLSLSLFGENLDFSIYPKRLHINLEEKSIHEIEIYNDNDKTLKFIIYKERSKREKDLSPYIDVYPKLISIEPKTKNKIKFIYRPLKCIEENKEYKSYIFFKELPVKKQGVKLANNFILYNEIGISIYGHIENKKKI